MFKILVADDDEGLRLSVTAALRQHGYDVESVANGEEALTKIRTNSYQLALLDVQMPKLNGIETLKELKAQDPSLIVILLTAYSNVPDAVQATKLGAYNYLEKPIQADNLVYMIGKALKAKSMIEALSFSAPQIKLPDGSQFIGQSVEMKKVFSVIQKLAQVDTPVLIRGQSGTGKELVARALHFNGPRKDNRFVSVNCSAIPETLIESEFFGHEKGSFTGADHRKIGKFQYADGGTLFLDEIGDISAAMQVKLLRVLQERKFMPIGSNREMEVNVRIVAATNRDLDQMIRDGSFREDLFYRLNVLPVNLPSLAERRPDIEVLIQYFIEKFNREYKKDVKKVSGEAMSLLRTHSWPGNIRELENVIEHAFVLEPSAEITVASLPELFQQKKINTEIPTVTRPGFKLDLQRLDFQANKEQFEKEFLIQALKTFKGRINQTALHANIPKKTLLRKLEKYGIVARDFSESTAVGEE